MDEMVYQECEMELKKIEWDTFKERKQQIEENKEEFLL